MQYNREVHQQLLMLKGLISELDEDDHEVVADVRRQVKQVIESYPEAKQEMFMGLAVEYIQYCIDNAEELSL